MDRSVDGNGSMPPVMASHHDAASDPTSPSRAQHSKHHHRHSSHNRVQERHSSSAAAPEPTRRRRSSTTDDDKRGPVRARRTSRSQGIPIEPVHHRRRSSAKKYSDAPRTPGRQVLPEKRAGESNVNEQPIIPRSNMDSPVTPRGNETDRMLEAHRTTVNRKKSLVKPERRHVNREDVDYHYRKHAQNMPVMPSTTGRDPQLEGEPSDFISSKQSSRDGKHRGQSDGERRRSGSHKPKKLSGAPSQLEREQRERAIRDAKIQEAIGAPTLWGTYCHLITVWCPDNVLRWFGFKERERRRAWREKMGLLSIIAIVMGFVGFLTFGFTETVCSNGGGVRLRINHVSDEYMIFHGKAYDLSLSHHPAALGIPAGVNVLYSLPQRHAGQDGSFLFQNVNGACKGLIIPAPGSDVPTDSYGNLAWYFPCQPFNQDGSSPPDLSIPYYLGYACHTARAGREEFYGFRSSGHVYFTWDDVRNSSRNLIVYSGNVLDLNLLSWFNSSQVAVPGRFAELQSNPLVNSAIRGRDVTLAFSSGENKRIAQCLSEIIKVGSIDTDTVGCFASRVVLYLSLVFILGIVSIRFLAALLFQWFLCRKYAAPKTSMGGDLRRRNQQIEDWTDNIYRPPPKMTDPALERDRSTKRKSFLPTTSRFTSPYAIERALNKSRAPLTTMASQQATSRYLQSSGSGTYGSYNRSEVTLQTYGDGSSKPNTSEGKSSFTDSRYTAAKRYHGGKQVNVRTSGPQSLIHEAVVPQPPPDWQPFGFPLAHAMCLVTAYSEGLEGIRTTLDSIAMTDYPNSHKLMLVVCDGLVKGKGESMSTPDACLSMLKDHVIPPSRVQPFSYVAVASGAKRHNMAKVYAGFYDYGHDSIIPLSRQQRVPMIVLVKCGNPSEAKSTKPGNRGKRDSQTILMSFLQKVMFDERMTELEYEIFNGIWKITGISPDFYEMVLMVDADTKIFPDSMSHMVSAMVHDSEIMGLCGETKIANKSQSWVTMIQVFEYFISHHSLKSFESCFGGVTCLPGCFCMYRIKTPKGGQNYWVPILANPDIVEHYSENVVDTLHKKNLYLLGEDRYLSTLMLKTFPKRKQVFVPQAVCKTTVPETFSVLLSQRRRWINSTIHNLMELVLVRDLCGTFCFSMQFVVFIDLIGTIVLPAAICFTMYVGALGIKAAVTNTAAPIIPLVLLALILGLPGILIVVTAHRPIYVMWMLIYLISLPIWNLVLPAYAYWHFDDFSWGDTRQAAGDKKGSGKRGGHDGAGEFDSSQITMKRWADFEQERRAREAGHHSSPVPVPHHIRGVSGAADSPTSKSAAYSQRGGHHERKHTLLSTSESHNDYP